MLLASVNFVDDPKLLLPVLDFAENVCEQIGLAKEKGRRLRLAFEEMLSQRMEKAYPNGGMFSVELELNSSYLELSLKDKGEPYWINEDEYDPNNIGDTSGLENYISRNMVDVFGTEKQGKDGQRMYFRLELPNPLTLEVKTEEEKPLLDTNFRVKRVTDDMSEITDIISCLYSEYGYSYPNEGMYYPEEFRQRSVANEYCSFLVVNDHGEVGGHGALSFSPELKNMPEFAGLVVKERFRGQHVSRMLFDRRLEEAGRMELPAVWGEPVGFHTGAQTNFTHGGFHATAFRFNYLNRDCDTPYRKGDERLPVGVCVKILRPHAEETVYLPEEYHDFGKKVFGNLGLSCRILPGEEPVGETVASTGVVSRMNIAHSAVSVVGADYKGEAKTIFNTAIRNHVDMSEVMILLCNPGAPAMMRKLRKLGYFFAGLVPGSDCGSYALMLNTMGDKPDFDRPVTMGEFTDILADLKSLYLADKK